MIRNIQFTDISQICQIYRDEIRSQAELTQPEFDNPSRLGLELASLKLLAKVYVENSDVLGFYSLEFWRNDLYLTGLAVKCDRQREGIGSELLGQAEKQAKLFGNSTLKLEPLRSSYGFYVACGYQHSGYKSRSGYCFGSNRFEKDLSDVVIE